MGGIGIVTIKLRHTLEIGIMGLVGGMGLMGEVGRDGGGKYAAEVHGEERVNGRDWDCHDQIATHTGDGDNGFDG